MSAIIMGIDEVGYGPILGPLVVTSCTFLVPQHFEDDMWTRLQESVGKYKKGLGNRLLVTDSKKAYSRSSGIGHLERTTLAFLGQMNIAPYSFSHLLSSVSLTANSQLQKYPWYSKTRGKHQCGRDTNAMNRLRENMENQEIELLDVRCCYIDVKEFNYWVQFTGNKADVLLSSILQLIQQVIALASLLGEKHIIIVSDRIGGRKYYEEILKALQGFKIVDTNVSERSSKYQLSSGKKTLNISFEVGADDNYLPVALSSMVGKYVREVILKCMCTYFVELQPGLKPTAGYWTDGHRFLKDLKDETLDRAGIERGDLVRIK